MRILRLAVASSVLVLSAHVASAACVNKFLARTERPMQVITLLTGKLTFQEATELAAAIQKKQAPPIEWLMSDGKTYAKQHGDLKVVRPMPVGCDGKSSGVVIVAQFGAVRPPAKTLTVKLTPDTTVTFEEQSN